MGTAGDANGVAKKYQSFSFSIGGSSGGTNDGTKKSYDSKPSSHQGGLSQEVPLSKQWIKTYKTSTEKSSETFVNGQQKE